MPRRRLTMQDRLFRYKTLLELQTGTPWSWLELAEQMDMDASTLRNVRYHPDNVTVSTLRRVEKFLRSNGVPFSVSDYLADATPALTPTPA